MDTKITLSEKFALVTDAWTPKLIGQFNQQHLKVVIFKGPFIWHYHENEDELFLVVRGSFRMEFRDGYQELAAGELLIVPRGVEHRPVADEQAEVLLIEPASTLNTGNVRNHRTIDRIEPI